MSHYVKQTSLLTPTACLWHALVRMSRDPQALHEAFQSAGVSARSPVSCVTAIRLSRSQLSASAYTTKKLATFSAKDLGALSNTPKF